MPRKQLRGKGLHPTSIREVAVDEHSGLFSRAISRNRKGLAADFTRQLATMLNAGIKLTDALTVLVQQQPDPRFKNALSDIRDRVVTGESFADAMAEYADFFDIIFISMIRVGEVTGTLGTSLETMAGFIDKRRRVESKMTTAMIYPCVLIARVHGGGHFHVDLGHPEDRRADREDRPAASVDHAGAGGVGADHDQPRGSW